MVVLKNKVSVHQVGHCLSLNKKVLSLLACNAAVWKNVFRTNTLLPSSYQKNGSTNTKAYARLLCNV